MSTNITRRAVLRNIVAGAAATGMAGQATADADSRTIVGLEAGAGLEVARRRANSVHRELDFGRIGKAVAGRFSEQALEALENNPNVRYVEDDGQMHALAQTLPWGIERVGGDVLHANGETGAGADIAIIDTGIDDSHPDLQGNLGTGRDFTGTGSWNDDNNHGTHCAGIANAIDNSEGVVGVSTEATLHAVKVLDSGGSGTISDIAAGIEWVADQGYDVGSLSLGGSSGSTTLQNAVQYAQGKGVLLVAAAGNSGPCSDCVGYPAAYPECIAVSATTPSDSLASYSSTGPEVELAAPGGASDGDNSTSIYSSIIGGYDYFNGTSMACPHVSGAAGQLMANGYTSSDARQRLQNTAEDVGLGSNEQGHGLLDAETAVLGSGGSPGDCVDATNWPSGTGYSGYEHLTNVNLDGQVEESSGINAYYDFTCPDVVEVQRGGSFTVALDYEDDDFDGHYGDVSIDWDQNGDWTTATETRIMENASDDTVTYSAEVPVPLDAATGSTLARVRLSYGGFDDPDATGAYGEVNDFTVRVLDCVDATQWPEGTGSDGSEHITQVNVDGQVVKSSGDGAYYDFTCPDVVTVQQGGSFEVALDYENAGFDGHYGDVSIDWDQNGDWTTATPTTIMQDVSDDTVTYTATVDVPSDAVIGSTLARVRLSWGGFKKPGDTDEFGEVDDFTIVVE